MKTKLFLKVSLLAFLILFSVFNSFSLATNISSEEVTPISDTSEDRVNDILASYETNYTYTSSDLFLYNTNVEMSEIVDGNVFAYGPSVNITGEIYGDLFVITNSLTISKDAVIHGNIFAYATNFSVSGLVSDIYAISNTFSLEDSAILARGLYLSSNTVSLKGQINRDAHINTDSLELVGENAEIQGNLHYTSKNSIEIPENAVKGEVKYTAVQTNSGNVVLSIVLSVLKALIFSFAIIMLIIWIAPNFKERASKIIAKKGFNAFGIGLLVFFGTILISFFLLFFTYGFGMSIAATAIGLLILVYTVSNTVFSMSIGKLLANKFNFTKNTSFVLFSLLIVLVLNLVKYIPYIGTPVVFITSIIGIGIISMNAFKRKDLVGGE